MGDDAIGREQRENDDRLRRKTLTRNRPLSVSRLARSTALWVARRSAVFALRDERFAGPAWVAWMGVGGG